MHFVITNSTLRMKKENSTFSALLSKITPWRKNTSTSEEHKNYTSLVDNFKNRFELD